MRYTIRIRENATGEVVERVDELAAAYEAEDLKYWWSEGNGACDCNRHNLFRPDSEWAHACMDGRFSVQVICEESGVSRIVFDDFERWNELGEERR